ncbi:MAG: guanylate kinase [Bacteroidales bacterium]|nr:guanylate kinase [Bacteroidales bacterium]
MKKNKVIIFSAPSGAGKSTVVKHLMKEFPNLGFSISATSRKPRGKEQHGREYYFLSPQEFVKKIENNEFVEYEEVYTNLHYGTLKSEVERIWAEGKIAIFDIDVKGGINLKKLYGNSALSIFIMPPSIEVLKERLLLRGTETPKSMELRLAKAAQEIKHSNQFDTTLINDNLEQCLLKAEEIVRKFNNQ